MIGETFELGLMLGGIEVFFDEQILDVLFIDDPALDFFFFLLLFNLDVRGVNFFFLELAGLYFFGILGLVLFLFVAE
jgi:hypothetical protein